MRGSGGSAPHSHSGLQAIPWILCIWPAAEGRENMQGIAWEKFLGATAESVFLHFTHIPLARIGHRASLNCKRGWKIWFMCPGGKGNEV